MEYSGTTSLEYVRTKPLFLTQISKNKCYNIYFLRTNTSRFTDCRIHDVRRKSLVFFLGTLSSVWMQIHDIFKQHICNVISFKNGSHWHFQYYWYFLLVFFFLHVSNGQIALLVRRTTDMHWIRAIKTAYDNTSDVLCVLSVTVLTGWMVVYTVTGRLRGKKISVCRQPDISRFVH